MNFRYTRFGAIVVLCLSSLAAQASMTLYGFAQMEFGNQKVTGTFPGLPAPINENYATDNNFGRIGIIVEEKVAHGFTAIGKFEFKINIATGSLGNSEIPEQQGESFIGLKTKWGVFQFGAVKSPFKYWGGESYDPFANTALEARNHGGMSGHTWSVDPASLGQFVVDPPTLPGNTSFGHDGFMENSASWKTLKFFGFEIWGSFSLDKSAESLIEIPASDPDAPNTIIDPAVAYGDYTFGIRYTRDNFEIGFGAFKNRSKATVAVPDAPTTDGRKFFTRYTRDKHTISLQWERIKTDRQPTENYESRIYFLGYQYKWNENSVFAVQYGHSEVLAGNFWPDMEVDYYAVGFIYGLSKKYQLYGGYSKSEVVQLQGTSPDRAERSVVSFGMRMIY